MDIKVAKNYSKVSKQYIKSSKVATKIIKLLDTKSNKKLAKS